MGEAPDHIVLVENEADVDALEIADPQSVAYISQTTLSVDETRAIILRLRERFPAIVGPRTDDICYATTNRQAAVKELAKECDLVLVIGSRNSSNSNRLVEVAREHGAASHLIDNESEVQEEWLEGMRVVGITSGASAPEELVERLVAVLPRPRHRPTCRSSRSSARTCASCSRRRSARRSPRQRLIRSAHARRLRPAHRCGPRTRARSKIHVSPRCSPARPSGGRAPGAARRRRSNCVRGRLQDALAAASRVLPELVAGLGTGREVVLLVGNHDHQLQEHGRGPRLRSTCDARQAPARRSASTIPASGCGRRLRPARPLPRPPHDDACVRADRRRRDGAVPASCRSRRCPRRPRTTSGCWRRSTPGCSRSRRPVDARSTPQTAAARRASLKLIREARGPQALASRAGCAPCSGRSASPGSAR